MTKFRSLAVSVSAVVLGALNLAGCEDSTAKAGAQVQADLQKATEKFHAAVLASTGSIDDAQRSELRGLLTTLSSAQTNAASGPGQKAAASNLAADVHRVLADSQLQLIDDIRAKNRIQRAGLHGMVGSAERLLVIAESLESSDITEQLNKLKDARASAEEALRSQQSEVASLQPSLEQLQAKIDEARAQVQGLREQENQLRRQASELGYSKGFKTYEEAISVRRQADVIETATSYDELERDFEIDPRVSGHQQRVEQIEAMIANIDIAIEELNANAASSAALAQTVRKDLNELIDRMAKEVGELSTAVNDELKPAIDAAASDLASAATKANSAASGGSSAGNSARLSAASANIALGQLHASWARELEQRENLLSHLANSSLPGMKGSFATEIAEAKSGREAAIQEAVSAYNSAIELYDRITGPGQTGALTLRSDAEAAVAILTGQPAPTASSDTSMDDGSGEMSAEVSGDAASSPMPAGPTGADSPEALAAAIAAMTTPEAMMSMWMYQLPLDKVNFSSPGERQLAAASADSTRAMSEFFAAVKQQFGSAADQALQPMMMASSAAMPKVSGASVVSSDGDRGEISITTDQGTQNVAISQVDGRWYIGTPDDFTGGFAGGFDEMGGVEGPQVQQMVQMLRKTASVTNGLTQRVLAGEFANAQALMMAYGQAMQSVMQP